MKIFLLVVTILLFICRIKSTPYMLSKNLYCNKMQKALNKQREILEEQREVLKEQNEENIDALVGASILLILLLEIFYIVYYILVGNRFSTNTIILFLSAIQIVTVVATLGRNLNRKLFSKNIEDFKFYRWYFLFNLILDYIYYPLTIYMLLS